MWTTACMMTMGVRVRICHLYLKEMQNIIIMLFFLGFISLISLFLCLSTVPVSHIHSSSAHFLLLGDKLHESLP